MWLNSPPWIFDVGLRRMYASQTPGWAPQAAVFSLFALAIVGAWELGVPVSWALTLIGALDILLTQHFLRDVLGRMRRLGWFRPTRACWWIELAALDWTLLLSLSMFVLTPRKAAAALPAWHRAIMEIAFQSLRWLFPAFLALTVVAFGVGLIGGKRIRGRSLELVNFFFWLIVFIGGSMLLVPQAPVLANVVAPALLIVSVLAVCTAAVLAIRQRILQNSGSNRPRGCRNAAEAGDGQRAG